MIASKNAIRRVIKLICSGRLCDECPIKDECLKCTRGMGLGYDSTIDEFLESQPIQPELHWIPCSERLPKEEGFYLVTLEHEYGAETSIRFFKFENNKRYWSKWGNEDITAWMPKPIPYQTQKEVAE